MIIKTKATKTAYTISWSKFKDSVVKKQSRLSLTPTTLIPDVIDDLFKKSEELDSAFKVQIIIPNGYTSASMDFAIIGHNFEVTCSRRLVRGCFPFNPFAAEFGGNYDVTCTINAENNIEKDFEEVLKKYKINS